jgi:hypothetical protein
MTIIADPRPTHPACAWCAAEIPVVIRPGRPRLYCAQPCRQRAYEHRHGFIHQRTVRTLPGQHRGQTWTASGYEQGGFSIGRNRIHALRTSVRPEGRRRETVCGVLAAPVPGRHFNAGSPRACRSCAKIVRATPLHYGISPSNELANLRALLDEADEQRIAPNHILTWIRSNAP